MSGFVNMVVTVGMLLLRLRRLRWTEESGSQPHGCGVGSSGLLGWGGFCSRVFVVAVPGVDGSLW